MLRAFVVAGRQYTGKRLGSFESWSETICGAIVYAGLPNPLETVLIVREQDNTGAIVRMLFDGLAAVAGVEGLSSREILDGITSDSAEDSECWEQLRAAFSEITDKLTTRKVGNTLKRFQNRVCNGQRLVKKTGRSNLARWSVESLEPVSVELTNVGNCDQCGDNLASNPTADGYLNRRCERCDKDFPCIPIAA